MKKIIVAASLGLGILIVCLLVSEALYSEELVDTVAIDRAIVTWADVGAPRGRFLLVRKDKDLCALRFTEYHSGHDARPPTWFDSGEESFYAEYDWFYQRSDSTGRSNRNFQTGHGKLTQKSLVGVGRFAFQTGNTHVECGSLTLRWGYPTRVSFFIRDRIEDYGVELAPTKWTDIGQVDFRSMNLKWYRVDESRKMIYIPLDQLP